MRDDQPVAGQCLAMDDVAQVVGEMLERREAAGFGVEMHKIKTPAALLATAVLPHQTIKPTLQSPCQIEIGAIDGEYERCVQHTAVEPVRQDQFESPGVA